MKITKRQLKDILKEEISQILNEQEEVDLQKLEPVADSVVAVVEKELDKVPETEQLVVMQAVISKLQALMGGSK